MLADVARIVAEHLRLPVALNRRAALNLHAHLHALAPDGVCVEDGEALRGHAMPHAGISALRCGMDELNVTAVDRTRDGHH